MYGGSRMTTNNEESLRINLTNRSTRLPVADGLCLDISIRTKVKNAFRYLSEPSVNGVVCVTIAEILSSCNDDRRAFPMDYSSPCGDNFDGVHLSIPSELSTGRAINAFRSMKKYYSYRKNYEANLASHLEWVRKYDISDVEIKCENLNKFADSIRECRP